jgi:hypothetical protein
MDGVPLVFAILATKNQTVLSNAKQRELAELIRANTYYTIDGVLNQAALRARIVPTADEDCIEFHVPSRLMMAPTTTVGFNTYFTEPIPPALAPTFALAKVGSQYILFSTLTTCKKIPDPTAFVVPESEHYTKVILSIK